MKIGKYLSGLAKLEIYYEVDKTCSLQYYINANFTGTWTPDTSIDPNSTLSYTRFVIFLHGCPLF